jgi:uncharacterized protein YndB with AHSA1/START domain
MSSRFVNTTYIHTTPEKLWDALTQPDFTRQYWVGTWQECAWEKGASWKLMIPDGRLGDSGEVVEIDRPRRFVLRWRHEFKLDLHDEGFSRCTMELEPQPHGVVKLTVTHEMERDGSRFIDAVSNGWPKLFASLKTLMETGQPMPGTSDWPKGM